MDKKKFNNNIKKQKMDDGWMDSTSRTQQNYLNKNAKCEKNKKKIS